MLKPTHNAPEKPRIAERDRSGSDEIEDKKENESNLRTLINSYHRRMVRVMKPTERNGCREKQTRYRSRPKVFIEPNYPF